VKTGVKTDMKAGLTREIRHPVASGFHQLLVVSRCRGIILPFTENLARASRVDPTKRTRGRIITIRLLIILVVIIRVHRWSKSHHTRFSCPFRGSYSERVNEACLSHLPFWGPSEGFFLID